MDHQMEKDMVLVAITRSGRQDNSSAVESNEELYAHLEQLLSQIKPDPPHHEEIDFGIEGDELI